MTLTELVGGVVGAVAAAVATYSAVVSKINSAVGNKDAPGDASLRDLVMRLDGKLDAQHDATTRRFDDRETRLDRVEARVCTPPHRPAIRVAARKPE